MSWASKNSDMIIGGESRVDLLPQELRVERKGKVVRRRLGFLVILVAVVVVGISALVRAQAVQAKFDLSIAQANAQSIVAEERKYVEVQNIQKQAGTILAAQQVGTSTEINWKDYLNSVRATLPASVTLGSVSIDSATPFASYAQASAPLQGERIATLSFTAISSTLPQVPKWLLALATLPGYADANPGSVNRTESGSYSVNITMHINQAAFAHRFTKEVS
jgi:ABC-type dipeptide/oligopeptide/nickel transport system permease component